MALEADKLNRLQDVPDDFLKKIPKSQSQIYDQVVVLLSRLEVRGGVYVISNKNLQIASEISGLLREVLLASDYTKYVTEFAKEFDQQALINNKLFESAFPAFTAPEIGATIVNLAKREAIDLLLNRESDTKFVAPLREIIEQSVINGAGYQETLKSIRTFIEGNEGVDGALLHYSKTYAHDTYAIADRAYTSVVSEELDVEWFKWAGGVIQSTRPFCLKRHNKFYHYKEIESWGDLKWDGKIPETNSATIFSYAGGYNCRHSIMPQSVFNVPKEDILRNIENGNYSPSEKELELLGM